MYVYVCMYVCNAVAAILNLILLLRKIATGESSIPWNRSLGAKTELPPIFYNSTWRYVSRTSECAPQRKRLQYTGHTELQILLSISLFYCKCTVQWITEIDVGGYICTAKTFFFKIRIWSSNKKWFWKAFNNKKLR